MPPPQLGDSWGWGCPWQLACKMQGWHSHPEKHKSPLPPPGNNPYSKWKDGQSEETTKILKGPLKSFLLNL